MNIETADALGEHSVALRELAAIRAAELQLRAKGAAVPLSWMTRTNAITGKFEAIPADSGVTRSVRLAPKYEAARAKLDAILEDYRRRDDPDLVD